MLSLFADYVPPKGMPKRKLEGIVLQQVMAVTNTFDPELPDTYESKVAYVLLLQGKNIEEISLVLGSTTMGGSDAMLADDGTIVTSDAALDETWKQNTQQLKAARATGDRAQIRAARKDRRHDLFTKSKPGLKATGKTLWNRLWD